MDKKITAYLSEIGRRGGWSKSAKKIKACRKNIKKALLSRRQK